MILYKLINGAICASQHVAEHGEEAAGHSGESGVSLHIPNLLTFIFGEKFSEQFAVTFFALFIALLIVIGSVIVYRKRQLIPGPLQNFVEIIVEWLYGMASGMLGKETDRYLPFVGTLFIYIWCLNMAGMVPFFHAPTSAMNMTVALAVTVFLYVQYISFTRMGFVKYLHHLAGEPNSGITWAMVIINFPLHFIGEFIKPFSLAMRLFGNIMGEDTLLAVMISLGIMLLASLGSPVGIPLQIPFYFLSLLLGTIQALVFMMLSTGYIMMALPHEEHAH